MTIKSLVPDAEALRHVDAASDGASLAPSMMVTDDADLIQAWAARHGAEPATGEATASGPATVDVRDGGAGIRFNFPGFGRFRPISWDEWFANLRRHGLLFVYEPGADEATGEYRLVLKERLTDYLRSSESA
jgi:hypothetical protein